MARKVIISCAVTGSIHTPTMSPYLPVTPEQIADQAIAAAEAGAAILHLHARDPENGRPSADPAVFMRFLPVIKQATDAVINITTGGSSLMTLDERLAAPLTAQPEMCSCNMGSMNFGLFPALDKPRQWKHEWEPQVLEATRAGIFKNTFADIEGILQRLGEGCGTRFEFECYDVGHLYNLAHFRDRGLVHGPLFIQFVFGVLGGIGADPDNLVHMKRIADKLFGNDYHFSVLAAGRHQMPIASMAAAMGGNVRVGLEDSIYIGPGELAKSNAEQVSRIRTILEALSLEIAAPSEAREILALKGADRVAFLRKFGVPTLIIRAASEDHVDSIFASIMGIARHVKEEHKVKSTRGDLANALFGPKPILEGVVAEIDEEYAGMCLFFKSYSTWLGAPGVYIQDLWVEETARNKRVGERLLQHVAALTRMRGGIYMRLSVDTQNFTAMRFYERLGLEHSDTEQVHAAYGDAFQALADGATQ